MGRLKLNRDDLGLSSLFEKITRARVKDCFKDEDTIYFVISTGFMGKALGKKGINIKKVQQELGKNIKLIEYRERVEDFVKNVIYPLKVEEITLEENTILLKDSSKKTKSLLIGRGSKNLNLINRAIKRFFNVDVKVV